MDKKICYSSAIEAIERFEAKTLSPVELLQALIDRAEKIESHVNAFTYEYYDEGPWRFSEVWVQQSKKWVLAGPRRH